MRPYIMRRLRGAGSYDAGHGSPACALSANLRVLVAVPVLEVHDLALALLRREGRGEVLPELVELVVLRVQPREVPRRARPRWGVHGSLQPFSRARTTVDDSPQRK